MIGLDNVDDANRWLDRYAIWLEVQKWFFNLLRAANPCPGDDARIGDYLTDEMIHSMYVLAWRRGACPRRRPTRSTVLVKARCARCAIRRLFCSALHPKAPPVCSMTAATRYVARRRGKGIAPRRASVPNPVPISGFVLFYRDLAN
jgi:hypothetical protein